jgi:hypothetical protein
VQVRGRRAGVAGPPDQRDRLALLNEVADRHQVLTVVGVVVEAPVLTEDRDRPPTELAFGLGARATDLDDHTPYHRSDRGALGSEDVDALVRPPPAAGIAEAVDQAGAGQRVDQPCAVLIGELVVLGRVDAEGGQIVGAQRRLVVVDEALVCHVPDELGQGVVWPAGQVEVVEVVLAAGPLGWRERVALPLLARLGEDHEDPDRQGRHPEARLVRSP